VNEPLSDNRLHTDPEIEGFRPIARRDPAVQTAQQRDRATTIYERSVEGRRAFVPPALDVPEQPLDELIPARLRRSEGP